MNGTGTHEQQFMPDGVMPAKAANQMNGLRGNTNGIIPIHSKVSQTKKKLKNAANSPSYEINDNDNSNDGYGDTDKRFLSLDSQLSQRSKHRESQSYTQRNSGLKRTQEKMGKGLVHKYEKVVQGDPKRSTKTPLHEMTGAGEQIHDLKAYHGKVDYGDYPETALDSYDYAKRLRFESLKKTRIEALCKWKQKDVKGIKKNAYIKEIQKKNDQILSVADKTDLERLEVYVDYYPILACRKYFWKQYIFIELVSKSIIQSKSFDRISTFVILVNSIVMMLDTSSVDGTQQPKIFVVGEYVFLVLYSLEMFLKILGMGFIFSEDAYLKEYFNILDFIIVTSSYSIFLDSGNSEEGGLSLNSLRTFRVLRPLKSISSIKGLKILMNAVLAALPLLQDTMVILLFFFIIMAIAGTQLLSGVLKNRCVNIQNGQLLDEEYLCGGYLQCPGGYVCGKSNQNPNFGTTNFDNIMYSFMQTFQCVTLEGWSDIQKSVQQAYGYLIFAFFVPMVFIGAFFLLNLTLAVINSSFNEETNKQQASEQAELLNQRQTNMIDDDLQNAMNNKDEMSIAQFITARIYAKKMIEFLRMRQEIKKIEKEKILKYKVRQEHNNKMKKNIKSVQSSKQESEGTSHNQNASLNGSTGDPSNGTSRVNGVNGNGLNKVQGTNQKNDVANNVIMEDEHEHIEEQSDSGQIGEDIKNFIKQSKLDLKRQGQNVSDIEVPKRINGLKKDGNGGIYKNLVANGNGLSGGPTMKGNIGPQHYQGTDLNNEDKVKMKQFAEDLFFENVIPQQDQKVKNNLKKDEFNKSIDQFGISIQSYDVDNYTDRSENDYNRMNSATNSAGQLNDMKAPKAKKENSDSESGLVTSDSDFEIHELAAGHQVSLPGHVSRNRHQSTMGVKPNMRKDVSKTFKKMLTSNHQKYNGSESKSLNAFSPKDSGQVAESTRYADSQAKQDFDNQTQFSSEIETKFQKKKMAQMMRFKNKLYKEDDAFKSNFELEKFFGSNTAQTKAKKEDIRQLEEFVSTKRPDNPFEKGKIDDRYQKVDIKKDNKYQGASQNDVFQLRLAYKDRMAPLVENNYLQLPLEMQDDQDPDFAEKGFLRTQWQPFQQKTNYIHNISSEENDSEQDPDDENLLYLKPQPYKTYSQIAYKHMLSHINIYEYAKRSDILITSTLSLSIFGKDKRMIDQIGKRALMNKDHIQEYVDQKLAFNATCKEHQYQSGHLRNKDKKLRDNYLKSFIHRSEFKSRTLQTFKDNTLFLNSNIKPVQQKNRHIEQLEKLKHDQNRRASEKRGNPGFDMDIAQRLLQGKYHDNDDEEGGDNIRTTNEEIYKNYNDIQHQQRMLKFELKLHHNIEADDQESSRHDEIPMQLRKEYNLPKDMGIYEINFPAIRKSDISKKKQQSHWSGQDILPYQIDTAKAEQIVDKMSENRVWPTGVRGILKRMRYVMRLKVFSTFFDNLMIFCVCLNTIVLANYSDKMTKEFTDLLEEISFYFTVIFIYEMASKILAQGMKKYWTDSINILDGSIVLLSIFEMVITAILAGDEGGLQSLKTIKILRTFRVFRIARLLRSLKSMQTILVVIQKSYMSFIYITVLMFLFIVIFSLTGTQFFGGKLAGEPRGNYDNFVDAFAAVFQVLTMENWQVILFDNMRPLGNGQTDNNKFLIAIYYITWIFIGNFILLNLFLAILLDSFLEDDEEEENNEEKAEKRKMKMIKQQRKKKELQADKVFMSHQFNMDKSKVFFNNQIFGKNANNSDLEDLEDLDEDQVVKIFKQQGIYKKDKQEEKEQILFEGIECNQSFYVFSKQNWIRIQCYKLQKHPRWDTVVLTMIIFSSIKLATDTYSKRWEDNPTIQSINGTIDKVFNIIFLLEMLVKLIALGLTMDEGSYLRESWNQLDFFIVNSSIIDMSTENLQMPFIRIFRMLRVLRPLRFITTNVALKMIVSALLGSMAHIFNVLIVVAMVFLIFAIMGVSFFAGGFYYCSIDLYVLHNQQMCEVAGGQWDVYDHNFDDVSNAMITLYVVSSLEGWPNIYYQALDLTGADKGPTKDDNPLALAFFIIFIFIGSFFFLNFFVGVLFLKFNQAQKVERQGFTDADMDWIDILKMIKVANPDYETTNVPSQQWRRKFHDLVSSSFFEKFIMATIMLNMVQMALQYEGSSQSLVIFLELLNYIFSTIFFIEAVLKLIAYGDTYFQNAWNRFDFFVVVSSILDILMSLMNTSTLQFLAVGPQLARVMRVMRVTRILRLAGKAEGLQAILRTISFSVEAFFNVFMLLMLIFFMFSILGCFLFNRVFEGQVIDNLKNFNDFFNAFLLLFALSTGEDWNLIMYDCYKTDKDGCIEGINCGSPLATVLFMIIILVCQHVMLNLFILVIIKQFDQYYLQKDNTINFFMNDFIKFMSVWKELTQERYSCRKIKENNLTKFFRKLGEIGDKENSLGFSEEYYDDGDLKKLLLKMGIKSDCGFIYFNELLYRCMKRKYGNMKLNKKMQITELKTQFFIFQRTLKIQRKNHKLSNQEIFEGIIKKENGVNPFLSVMNYKISFKTWLKFAKKNIKTAQRKLKLQQQKLGLVNLLSSDMPSDQEGDGKAKMIAVEIDVEQLYSTSSGEEDLQSEYGGKKRQQTYSCTNSNQGSNDLNPNQSMKKSIRMNDHLKFFESKMRKKFFNDREVEVGSTPGLQRQTTFKMPTKLAKQLTKKSQELNQSSAKNVSASAPNLAKSITRKISSKSKKL